MGRIGEVSGWDTESWMRDSGAVFRGYR